MEIVLYEDWMQPQVTKLFSIQYKLSLENSDAMLRNFYEHPYQANRCIRIVAKERDTVIGFQSFFHWPYSLNGQVLNSYQSGNSLVHPDHRGKGVFRQLLNFFELHRESLKIDLIVGFPIDVSVGSLLRNGWINLLNLKWYVRNISPFSLFRNPSREFLSGVFPYKESNFVPSEGNNISLLNTEEFQKWRKTLYPSVRYFSFQYTENGNEVNFQMKLNIRKKLIKEMIIGEICLKNHDPDFLRNAFKALIRTAKSTRQITILSIAINEDATFSMLLPLQSAGFKKINKEIYFCTKSFFENPAIKEKKNWTLYRGDIDTW